ncbi:MAG: hypothetical protein HGB12_16625 [Bacteroidetes bacterium]|nr:hypothetical protein [Bacteroidota bacterium]
MQEKNIFCIQQNKLGTFCMQLNDKPLNVRGIKTLKPLKESFILNIPKIPYFYYLQTIEYFKHIYELHKTEAYVRLFYNPIDKKFFFYVCRQVLTGAHVDWSEPKEDYSELDKLQSDNIMVLQIHSHPSFTGKFSGGDDSDQNIFDGMYMVIGHIKDAKPDYEMRFVFPDKRVNIDLFDVFEKPSDVALDLSLFPDWEKKVIVNSYNSTSLPSGNYGFVGRSYGRYQDDYNAYMGGDFDPVDFTQHKQPTQIITTPNASSKANAAISLPFSEVWKNWEKNNKKNKKKFKQFHKI